MPRNRSHSRNKKLKTVTPTFDPEIQDRIDAQLIFKNQLELTETLLMRLCSSSVNAGFNNAHVAFKSFAKNFNHLASHFPDAIEQKLEALQDLAY